ncbi:head decoration protein [Pseudomonas asplenii]|uniref:Bacteriophage lambda head decoration protein D n=1 Tax=Pseudomonas asplenii TaxID=53407 RepID=A0A1H6P0V1_9PSED|nr:head decoration protein [Pseudomonas fuscovaginae]SEI17186.1 Bacteriophage lambda head decoration protein D [Pseudomonas fuscovaginae]
MKYDIVKQGPRTAAFLLSEGNGQRSREQIILAAGAADLPAGQVLSKTSEGKYVAFEAPAEGATVEVAILYEGRSGDANADRDATGIVRECEVIESLLIGVTDPAKASLAAAGIILR